MLKNSPGQNVFLSSDKGGEAASVSSLTPKERQIEALKNAYEIARTEKFIQFNEPLKLDLLIGIKGRCQLTFPLASGANIGVQLGLGLTNPSSNHNLKSIEYDQERKGFWLEFSCLNKEGREISSKVLILENKSGKDAVKFVVDLQQDELTRAYQDAKKSGLINFDSPLSLDLLIGRNGCSLKSFPLANGINIGTTAGLGLTNPSSNHNLKSIEYDQERRGFWLELSCLNKDEKEVGSKVLILEDQTGRESVKLPVTLQQEDLVKAYQDAKKSGLINFDSPLRLDLLIGRNGSSLPSFPLANGINIGTTAGLGLTNPSSNHNLKSIEYDPERNGFWLELSSLNKDGKEVGSKVLILEDQTGRESVKLPIALQQEDLIKAYQDAKKSGLIYFDSPLQLDLLIGSNGRCQLTFPLSDGLNIGVQVALGLTHPSSNHNLKSIEYDQERKGFWLEFSCLNKERREISSKVLILENKSGKDAVKFVVDLQQDELTRAYQDAKKSGLINFDSPLRLDLLIGRNGSSLPSFPLANGINIGTTAGLGLTNPSSNHNLKSIEYDPERNGFWLELSSLNKDGKEVGSKVLILEDQTGRESVKLPVALQQEDLVKAYQDAKKSGLINFDSPLKLDLLIGSNGISQRSFPLANGINIGAAVGLGLSQNITSPSLKAISCIRENTYRLRLAASKDAREIHSDILVDSRGITVLKSAGSKAAEVEKGQCLDRYVSHLLASAGISAEVDRKYQVSALTGEIFEPNFTSGSTIIHSKWGNQGLDLLDYVLKYGRLQKLRDMDALHLVASKDKLASLQVSIKEAAEKLGFKTRVMRLSDWGHSVGLKRVDIELEILRIETLAAIDDIESLSSRNYEKSLIRAKNESLVLRQWQDRVQNLCTQDNYESLKDALAEHSSIHSNYWEREYHIDLAMHCSYLADVCLPESNLSQSQKEIIEKEVYKLYLELQTYRNAWIVLADKPNGHTKENEGNGRESHLDEFSLERELKYRGAVKDQISENIKAEYNPKAATEKEYFREKLKEIADQKQDPFRIAAELKGLSSSAREHGYSQELKSHIIVVLKNGIFAAGNKIPDELEQAKISGDDQEFVCAIRNMDPDKRIEYLANKTERKKIKVADIWPYLAE